MRQFALRLAILAAVAAASLSFSAPSRAQDYPGGDNSSVPLRKSVTALTPQEVMSLRRGVGVMMSRNSASRNSANFRRSWIFWANMHSHFGNSCAGAKRGGGMSGVKVWTANNANERATWCKCEHGTEHFLTWHRMYLYYFEQVLQQAAGDPNLRLPYWDYGTDAQLPLAFREATYVNEAGQTVANPLRVAARRTALNNGTAGLAGTVTSASNALAATSYEDFQSRLEQGPHGPVHCAIASSGCPTGLMGSVPASALDPIFYMHHSNIDRLYECWVRVDPAARLTPTNAALDRSYSFVDRDGRVVSRTVKDMLTTGQLGYGYTEGSSCPAAPTAQSTVVAETGETRLGADQTTTAMAVAPSAAAQGWSGQAPAQKRVTVVIDGLTVAKVPGVLYTVYLTNGAGKRVPVGTIDFFGFGDVAAAGHSHGGNDGGRSYTFDATDAVAQLGLKTSAAPRLVFEPTTGLTNSTPQEAARDVPAGADVRFKRARLRVEA